MWRVVAMVSVFFLAGCGPHKTEIMVDAWWTLDDAKNSCLLELDQKPDPVCAGQAQRDADNFLNEIVTDFGQDTKCRDVTVFVYRGPGEAEASSQRPTTGDYWTLMVDYTHDQKSQEWGLTKATYPFAPEATAHPKLSLRPYAGL